ncbi:MAG: TIM barrel protein [Chitinivibrionales bacterium]|nr:TIM barrel protein [Chitinivibrionales bacterium]MBD3396093.1 TIM barrel protein [Chitinivibrionales bacterium]
MPDIPPCAVITSFLSRTKDRFHEYNEDRTLEERLALVKDIEGMAGVEAVYPYEVGDAKTFKALIEKYGLGIAAINVNVKAEPEFRNGGLTSRDPGVRARAVQLIKDAKDFARATGADKVTCCPLGDGYEFNFHCDYARMWDYLVETFGEAGSYLPEIPLFVEYKPSETRGRCFVDTGAKALCLLKDIGLADMGVTVDYGHSTYGNENPAEVVSLLEKSPFRYYIHINDNDGRWDWDYMVGTHHFLGYVEFLYYLRKYNYTDYLTSDTSPTRWDIKGTFEANTRMTKKIWRALDALDTDAFAALIAAGDFLATWKFIETHILKLED